MADSYGPGGQDPRDNSQEGNTYHYKYSYGSGRGSTPSGGYKPPKKSNDWSEWVGIAFLMLVLPFTVTKLIGGAWLVMKLVGLAGNPGQQQRYRQEAKRAAQQARNAAENFFQQSAQQSSGSSRQSDGQTQQSSPGAARQSAAGQAQQSPSGNARQGQEAGGSHTYSYRYGQRDDRESGRDQPQPDPWEARDQAEERRQKARKQAKVDSAGGKGLIIAGGIMSGIFGLGTAAVSLDILQSVIGGYFWPEDLIGLLALAMFLACGLGMLATGFGKNRSSERYMNYLAYIGANREVALAPMAASFGTSVGKLCKDLRRMLAKGILPTGYLDLAEGKLFLTEMGYRAPESRKAPPVEEETPQQAAAREDDILREIRQVNDEIPDEIMSAKIDRIEEITSKILTYQKAHPNKEGQLRTFLNYYLPTTLKILRAYAQLDAQGIEGENISAAKKRIEDMMDQVVYGFEKQLDKLFQDDAMDIASDVEVLESMLKKDGLSDAGGITMTL